MARAETCLRQRPQCRSGSWARGMGAGRDRLQPRVRGGEWPELPPCPRRPAAPRSVWPGLRGVGAHTGRFLCGPHHGGVPPPEALGASCHKRASGPGDSGPRFPSRGLVLGDQVGSAFLPSPSTRLAPAPCPALCPLTGGPGPGCSDLLHEGHPPPRPDPGLSPRKPILSGRGLPGAGGRVLVGGTASTPRDGPAFFPGHPGSPPLPPGTASGQPSVGSVGCFRTAGPAGVREPQPRPCSASADMSEETPGLWEEAPRPRRGCRVGC